MSDVFSFRWSKEPDPNEQQARDILERWKDEKIVRDMLVEAIIKQDGKDPVTDTVIINKFGRLLGEFQRTAERLSNIDLSNVTSVTTTGNRVVMEFDDDFDDAMMNEWDE